MNQLSQAEQVLLRIQYQQMRHTGTPLPALRDTEFRCYSQNGEDGILLFLFSVLGATDRRALEICCENGIECNAANLIVNHSWQALLIDGSPANISAGQAFYTAHLNTRFNVPTMAVSWVTAENVDGLIARHGFSGSIDLFSLDVDGNDYWIWRAIQGIQPRVVVLEFNALLGPERALTLPYDPGFKLDLSRQPFQCGASLPAFVKLGREKGYRLVGVNALGINAFFVRNDVGPEVIPEVSCAECFATTGKLRGYAPSWLEAMYRDGQRWDEV
jgi:hypothetical protein